MPYLRVRCVHDPPAPDDGWRLLVSRLWPRGRTWQQLAIDQFLPELAPSYDLLREYHYGELGWDEYATRFLTEVAERADYLASIAVRLERKPLTLLCLCPADEPQCHARLLEDLLNRAADDPLSPGPLALCLAHVRSGRDGDLVGRSTRIARAVRACAASNHLRREDDYLEPHGVPSAKAKRRPRGER